MTDLALHIAEDRPAAQDASAPTAAPRRHGERVPLSRTLFPYLLLFPSLIFLALFTYWPIVQVVTSSLGFGATGIEAKAGAAPTLHHYVRLWQDEAFRTALLNNLIYAIGTIAPSIVIAVGLAVGLQESTRFNAFLRTIVFFPVLIPLVAAAALFLFVFMPGIGLLDYYLAKLGVASTNWLGNPDLALMSLCILTIWKNAGYYMLFFLAGLQAIPKDLYDAAKLDGAGPWVRFTRLTLPLLGPTFAFVIVIAIVNALSQVDHVFVLTKGGPSNASNLILFYIYQTAHESYDASKAAAATFVTLVLLVGLSAVSLRTLERGAQREAL